MDELTELQAKLGTYTETKSFRELAKEHPEIPGLRALASLEVTDSAPDTKATPTAEQQ